MALRAGKAWKQRLASAKPSSAPLKEALPLHPEQVQVPASWGPLRPWNRWERSLEGERG